MKKGSDVNNRKKRSISVQLMKPMTLFMFLIEVVIVAACALLVVYFTSLRTMRFASEQAEAAATDMASYRALDSLVEYWYEHRDEMDRIYDPAVLSKMEMNFRSTHPEIGRFAEIGNDMFCLLPESEKKAVAEIAYGRLSQEFDGMKNSFKPLYLFSFIVRDDQLYFLVTGTTESEARISQGGDIFELGTVVDYRGDVWKRLDSLLKGESIDSEYHIDVDTLAYGVMASEPVYSNGQMVAVVASAEGYTELLTSSFTVAFLLVLILLIMFGLMGVMIVGLIRNKVLEPISSEESAIREYMESKDSASCVEKLELVKPGNELETLAESFSAMIQELELHVEHIRAITTEKERIGAELSVAEHIQADMLPNVFPPYPDRKEFELFALMDPAKEVGGDFYDFFFTDGDHIALVMADVSGKGVPAALFMAISKTIIKNMAITGARPSEILSYSNDALADGNDENMFVTVWLAIIELSTGHVISANAGHEHPAIRRAGGLYELDIYEHDMVLAMLPAVKPFSEREFDLNPGDSLFIYTDGVPEAQNADQEFFGNERLLQTLNDDPDADAEKTVRDMAEAIESFDSGAEQFDDITMLCFKYFGSRNN